MKKLSVLSVLSVALVFCVSVPSVALAQVTAGRLSARAIAAAAIRIGGRVRARHADLGRDDAPLLLPPIAGQRLRVRDGRRRHAAASRRHSITRAWPTRCRAPSGRAYSATRLPFNNFTFNDALSAIEMTIDGARWTCTLADYACRTPDVPPPGEIRRGISGPGSRRHFRGDAAAAHVARRQVDGVHRQLQRRDSPVRRRQAHGAQHRRLRRQLLRRRLDRLVARLDEARRLSRPSRLSAARALRRVVAGRSAAARSTGRCNTPSPATCSTSSSRCSSTSAARSRSRSTRAVPESVTTCRELVWRKDSRAFTFEYNQRGHQVYRVIEVDAHDRRRARGRSRKSRRRSSTTTARPRRCRPASAIRYDLADGKEIVWMSERDGWNHLYLYRRRDRRGEEPDHQGRRGWSAHVDQASTRRSGRSGSAPAAWTAGKDPYFQHYYRINFDGTGLTPLTDGRRQSHRRVLVRHASIYVDTTRASTWRRVVELRRVERRQAACCELETGDITALAESRLEGARGVRRQGPRRQDRHLGHHHAGRRDSIRRRSIR